MRHDWTPVNQGTAGMFNYGKRKCKNCGAVQVKDADTSWGRVVRYRWLPLAGKCKGVKINLDK